MDTNKKASWMKKKDALLKKYELDTDKILAIFYDEVKEKGLKSKSDTDKLWKSKYGDKLVKVMTDHRKKYKELLKSI